MLAEIAKGEEEGEEEGEWGDEEEEEELQGHPVEVLRCVGREIASLAKKASCKSRILHVDAQSYQPVQQLVPVFFLQLQSFIAFLNLLWVQVPHKFLMHGPCTAVVGINVDPSFHPSACRPSTFPSSTDLQDSYQLNSALIPVPRSCTALLLQPLCRSQRALLPLLQCCSALYLCCKTISISALLSLPCSALFLQPLCRSQRTPPLLLLL